MLKKINYNLSRTKIISNTTKFKSIFLLCIICNLINSFNIPTDLLFENAITYNISTGLYQILLFITLFLNSIYTMNVYNEDSTTFLRFKNKKNYLSSLILQITLMNIITYLIYSICGLIFVTLKYYENINFIQFEFYKIPYFIFNGYLYFKYFVIFNLLILIAILIYKNINRIIGSAFGIFLYMLKDNYAYSLDKIQSVSDIHLFYGYYLYPFEYSSFSLDLCAFFLQCIILLLIYELLKYINIKCAKISVED